MFWEVVEIMSSVPNHALSFLKAEGQHVNSSSHTTSGRTSFDFQADVNILLPCCEAQLDDCTLIYICLCSNNAFQIRACNKSKAETDVSWVGKNLFVYLGDAVLLGHSLGKPIIR